MSEETSTFFSIGVWVILLPAASVLATYLISKYVDKFCSANIDAAIIRRIEEMRTDGGNNDRRPKVVLDGMEPEERIRVLERVLDCKPYSRELGAQLKMQRERAEEKEKITEFTRIKHSEIENGEAFAIDNPEVDNDEEEQQQEINILENIWKEFGESKNAKNGGPKNIGAAGDEEQHHELTETCAICMEDYEENQDIIIGHNCDHIYHKECLLKWLSYKHDFCPYCRSHVFDVPTFCKTAEELLGTERYTALGQ